MKGRINPYVFPGIKNEFLPDYSIKNKRNKITPTEVLKIVSDHHSISVFDIIRKYNKREVSDARHMFCAVMKTELRYSLKSIGDILNGRDHTTIIHSIKTFYDRSKFEDGYKEQYEKIVEEINSKIN
jgi:chromosomal replication initiator protein